MNSRDFGMHRAWLALVTMLMSISAAQAAVTARVDRNAIDLNESFMLEIVVDTDIDLQPDVSSLHEDFYVGQSSQLSNTMIVNGEISRSRTWTYQLMAKRTGELVIPPVAVGSESSQPQRITVRQPTNAPPGEADVFITSEVDYAESYVQAQVLYRIKVYRAVPTRQPALRDPQFGGAEVLIEVAGEERSYDARLNDRTYNVVERAYAIFPQESGEVTISPARFEARVLRAGRITGRKVFESEPQAIRVLPIPEPPADFPDAAWLPARDLQLRDNWSRQPDDLKAGEPITRVIEINALGQLETQIPAIEPPNVSGVNIYPDRPELSRQIEPGGIRGVRKDQYAIIGVDGGVMTLPALRLPWWDVEAGEWKVAELPERSISILPSREAPVVDPAPTVTTPVDDTEAPSAEVSMGRDFWRLVAQVVVVLWLLTLAAWWLSSRPKREPREPAPPPLHKQQARHLKAARKAALSGDGAGVRQAMLEWGRLQWPDDTPRSIGALSRRVSAPLSDELGRLSLAAYGRNGEGWDGQALAKSVRSFAVLDETGEDAARDPLPPLMPQT
ncbi:MAG: BatD family protein [Gammaproteobacteria bacterium]|nr:BatD family protein [Gammaproteobacteria bacterium]